MRKYLLITTVTDEQYELDFPDKRIMEVGLGAPAFFFLFDAERVASNGFCPDPKATPPRWIAPSQIKHVEVVFENATIVTT